jgi:phage shock protein PspC (stress-responsive transcriptional regulator)
MNKVVTINLGGNAYQLEEGGYGALQAYLETAAARLAGNPDRDEILSDIERAIAEKFQALLSGHKTVVETKEVAAVLDAMGPIETEPGEASKSGESGRGTTGGKGKQWEHEEESNRIPRRLYRINEGAMIAGVCNGIGAYINVDSTIVRLAFVLLTLLWGAGLIVYLVMAFVIPEARSPEEKAAASGFPSTAQEFIRRAKEGYYGAMKGFPDSKARREWKRRFKREMRTQTDRWRYNWHSYWTQSAPNTPRTIFALPFLSVLHGAATVIFIIAIVSLLATGSVLGLARPAGVPVWILLIVLLVAYGILTGPLKFARRSYYYGGGRPKEAWSYICFLDTVIGIAVALALLWLVVHYMPELRNAIRHIPGVAHEAADDIRAWWHGM